MSYDLGGDVIQGKVIGFQTFSIYRQHVAEMSPETRVVQDAGKPKLKTVA